jgi:hypothetical protein
MMERFQNFVTGGASGTMKKASGKPKSVGDALSQ